MYTRLFLSLSLFGLALLVLIMRFIAVGVNNGNMQFSPLYDSIRDYVAAERKVPYRKQNTLNIHLNGSLVDPGENFARSAVSYETVNHR